jgi:hypothetical protein
MCVACCTAARRFHDVYASTQGVDLDRHIHNTYGYDIDAFPRDVLALFAIGLLVRIVGCVILYVADRKKKV